MKPRLFIVAALLGTSFAGGVSICRAQSSTAVDARITDLKCQAELGTDKSTAIVPLHSPADIGHGLSAGDRVRCVGAGYLEVLVPAGTKKITSPQGWFSIQAIPSNPPYAKIAENLRNFGIPGATRGASTSSRLTWPSENSAVIPKDFVVRWTPVAQKIHVSILSDAKDVTLWGPTEIEGGTGFLKSDSASSILAGYKAKSENPALVLVLSFADQSDEEEVHFSLLNGQQDKELAAQLDMWNKHTDGVTLRLGRGYSFLRFRLFAEAADEYDSALKSAPDSRYLLGEAIRANRLAGRTDRVKELQTRLASLPDAASQ